MFTCKSTGHFISSYVLFFTVLTCKTLEEKNILLLSVSAGFFNTQEWFLRAEMTVHSYLEYKLKFILLVSDLKTSFFSLILYIQF